MSVGVALLGTSVEMEFSGDIQAALGTIQEALERLQLVKSPRVRPLLTSGLVRMAHLLMRKNDYEAAVKVYANVAEDAEESSIPRVGRLRS